jgi:hypothetical protein
MLDISSFVFKSEEEKNNITILYLFQPYQQLYLSFLVHKLANNINMFDVILLVCAET